MLPSISAWYQGHELVNSTSSDNHHMVPAHNLNELVGSNPGISRNPVCNLSHLSLCSDSMKMIEHTIPQESIHALPSFADIALGSDVTPSSPVVPQTHQIFASPLILPTTTSSSDPLPSLPSSSTPYYYYYYSSRTATYINTSAGPPEDHIHQHCASKNTPSGLPKIKFSPITTTTSFGHSQPISVLNAEEGSTYSCQLCSATQTPKWRSFLKDSIRLRLCNACGLRETRKNRSAKNDHQLQTKARIRQLTLQKNSPFSTFRVS